jgi:peptidoglycan/xylan/chitin deacetylase (PgdA/CDA1 family)
VTEGLRAGWLAPLALLGLAGCGGATAARSVATFAATPPARVATTPAGSRRPRLAPTGHAGASMSEIDHGPRNRRWVALTFDADMTRAMLARLRAGVQRTWYDAAIVSELRATRTPATIFLTGLWTQAYPGVVRQLAHDRRFELENHSVDHSGWLAPCYGLPVVRGELSKRAEIEQAAAEIRAVAGITPRYFRFPGGCHSQDDLRLVAALGERAVGWDVVSGDAFNPDAAAIVRAVVAGVRPGSIVIMHIVGAPNAPATDRALPVIIGQLRARGYRFVTVAQLLAGSGG